MKESVNSKKSNRTGLIKQIFNFYVINEENENRNMIKKIFAII